MRSALVVHGGCGAVSAEEETIRNEACERAADAGWSLLEAGGTAIDAAEADGQSLEPAGRVVLAEIERLAAESAGLIAVDAAGTIVSLWDTPFIAWAKRTTAAR